MKSKFERLLPSINVVDSDDGGGEDTPTVISLVSYWGKTKRSKQDILQHRVVFVKINLGAEGSRSKISTIITQQLNY